MTLAAPLYLSLINFNIIQIGLVYVAVMAFAVTLSLLLGALGDRRGYKKALIISEVFPVVGALGLALSTSPPVIILSIVVAGVTGLSGGMRGAFSPGMTAFIASENRDDKSRVGRLSQLTLVSSLFSIVGAGMLISQSLLGGQFGGEGAYRLLFLAAAALLAASLASLLFLRETERPRKTSRVMQRSSLRYTLNVMVINAFNGAGIGMAVPLLPLILAIAFRFPVNDAALYVGIIYVPSYAATMLGSWLSGRLSGRFDVLSVASFGRVGAGLLGIALGAIFALQYYGVLTFLPLLAMAMAVYALRSLVAGFGGPSISALNVRGIHSQDYGTASSVQSLAQSLATGSSGLSGYLADAMLPAPILIGGALQIVSGALYPKLLKGVQSGGGKRRATA